MVFSYGNDILICLPSVLSVHTNRTKYACGCCQSFHSAGSPYWKEATDLNRIAELNPNQHDLNILWSIHNDNRAAITTPLDRFVEDGSYLRISTITLGYTFPKSG